MFIYLCLNKHASPTAICWLAMHATTWGQLLKGKPVSMLFSNFFFQLSPLSLWTLNYFSFLPLNVFLQQVQFLLSQGFLGSSTGKESACSAGDPGLIPGSGSSPGEEIGYPLQHSCPENPRGHRSWWATVHGVTKNWV